jgi:hypothetical protein
MSIGLAFWVLMLVWLVFGIGWHFGFVPGTVAPWANGLLIFILLGLLGWHSFGPPLHG